MKKNIALLFLSIFTVSILSGCAKTDVAKTNTEVAKVQQTALLIQKQRKRKMKLKQK